MDPPAADMGWILDFVRSFFAGAFFKEKMHMNFTSAGAFE